MSFAQEELAPERRARALFDVEDPSYRRNFDATGLGEYRNRFGAWRADLARRFRRARRGLYAGANVGAAGGGCAAHRRLAVMSLLYPWFFWASCGVAAGVAALHLISWELREPVPLSHVAFRA